LHGNKLRFGEDRKQRELSPIPVNEITLSLETLTVQGIQALEPNDNYCPKQPIFQNTPQCVGVAAVSASLYSDAETAVAANAYHSEKSPELAHQEDLRDRSQIHSRVLDLSPNSRHRNLKF